MKKQNRQYDKETNLSLKIYENAVKGTNGNDSKKACECRMKQELCPKIWPYVDPYE